MNLTRAFVSSTIDRPHLPSHILKSQSPISAASHYLWSHGFRTEDRAWVRRSNKSFILGICWYLLYFSLSDSHRYLCLPFTTFRDMESLASRAKQVFSCTCKLYVSATQETEICFYVTQNSIIIHITFT